jgi:hypothetical protein
MSLLFLFFRMCLRRDANRDMVVRDVGKDHGIGADGNVVADPDPAQYLGTRSNVHVVAKYGDIMLLLAVADSDPMAHGAVAADHRFGIKDDPAEVIDPQPRPDGAASRDRDPDHHGGEIVYREEENIQQDPERRKRDPANAFPEPVKEDDPYRRLAQIDETAFVIQFQAHVSFWLLPGETTPAPSSGCSPGNYNFFSYIHIPPQRVVSSVPVQE